MQKICLAIVTVLMLSGCSAVDDAINNAVSEVVNDTASGDVTAETIKAKDKVVIINNVNLEACFTIKQGLISNDFENPEVLVTELGVTCTTYNKPTGSISDTNSTCFEEDLVDWLDHESNGNITDFESAHGDKACVIGADL